VTERGQELDYFDSRSVAAIVIESNNNRKFAVVFPQLALYSSPEVVGERNTGLGIYPVFTCNSFYAP